MLDATKSEEHRRQLEYELDAVGIRLNKSKPDVVFKKRTTGDVYNKIDSISVEELDKLARQPNSVVISCEMDLNLDYLIERMWDELKLVKIYTKKRGAHPDLSDPICLRKGATIENGKSSKFAPHAQKVSLHHQVQDEDVVSIFTK
ncbi:hypothetical protein C0995_014161 [Termitomyces sp. Mi166|nr:hypothetical protein C0995_014161 [Termitomyces sp. Mi166\